MGRWREWRDRLYIQLSSAWAALRPPPAARRGLAVALFLFVVAFWGYFGSKTRIGFGTLLDGLLWAVAGAILVLLGSALLSLLLGWIGKLPTYALGIFLMAGGMIGFLWPSPLIGFSLAFLAGAVGATVASLWAGGLLGRPRTVATWTLLTLSVAGLVAIAAFLSWRGDNQKIVTFQSPSLPEAQRLHLPDPGRPGSLPIKHLTYGPGSDRHRSEYGAKVTLKSRTVDGTKLLKNLEGWKGKLLKWYWGHGTEKMPLNGLVWYPDGPGPFPLVLVVHGNHNAQEPSDPGYEYLGRHFASRGYILVSVDQNFINSGLPDGYDQKETPLRGWLLLEHLKLWREWNASAGHEFAGKVDLNHIGLIGHSRGGEAVATAFEFNRLKHFPGDGNQAFDYGFAIRSLIAIAPADGQYRPAGQNRTLKDVSYLTVHGSHDYDVSSFVGANQFQRTTFSPGSPHFKASLYIYRANHGQFNTVWGEKDWSPPGFWLLNTQPLITGSQQRQIALVYFTAFLDVTLKDQRQYLPLFEEPRRGAQWLPDTLYVSRFADASTQVVATFDEDYDLLTSTLAGGKFSGDHLALWKEHRLPFRRGDRGDNGVFLGWRKDEKASYAFDLPAGFKLMPGARFGFALADADEKPPRPDDRNKGEAKKDDAKDKDKEKDKEKEDDKKPKPPIDLTVEFIDASGGIVRHALSEMGPVFPPLRTKLAKLSLPGWGGFGKDAEPTLQQYSAPAPLTLRRVRFVFDRTPEGVVILDDLAVIQSK